MGIGRFAGRILTLRMVIFVCLASLSGQVIAVDITQEYSFDIEIQPLSKALISFSRQTGIVVVSSPDLVRGEKSSSIDGVMSVDDALRQLLRKTELEPIYHTSIISLRRVAQAELLEEVLTVGIRKAIQNARDEKYSQNAIVDAYFSEDIGKSSDENIAEALRRLPGVSNAGDGTVIVRGFGPAMNMVTFNGVPLTSNTDDQSVNLSSFSADILSKIVVEKSVSASSDEGSLGGSIALETHAPMEQDNDLVVVGGEYGYQDLSGNANSRLVLNAVKKMDRHFAVSTSFFWDDRQQREDRFENFGASTAAERNNPIDSITGETLPDQYALSYMFPNYRSTNMSNDKYGGTVSVQWWPATVNRFRLDYGFSRQNDGHMLFEDRSVNSAEGDQGGEPIGLTVVDRAAGRVLEYYDDDSGLFQTRARRGDTSNTFLKLEYTRDFSGWDIRQRLVTSRTNQNHRSLNINATGFGSRPSTQTFGAGNGYCGWQIQTAESSLNLPVFYDCPHFNRADISVLGVRQIPEEEREVKDRFSALYTDITLPLTKLFSSAEFGLKVARRKKSLYAEETFLNVEEVVRAHGETNSTTIAGSAAVDTDNDGYPDIVMLNDHLSMPSNSGVLQGIAPTGVGESFPAPNPFRILDELFPEDLPSRFTDRLDNHYWEVNEDILALYSQLNFDLFDDTLIGDVGLRWVNTRIRSVGASVIHFGNFVQENGDDYPDTYIYPSENGRNSYSELLPSLNLRYDFSDDWVLRFSIGKSMARPNLNLLRPSFSISNQTFDTAPSGEGGNPNLNPFVTTQMDLGVEWYFNSTSLLSATFFYKKIHSFSFLKEEALSFANPVTGEDCLVDRSAAPAGDKDSATVEAFGCRDVVFRSYNNGAKAKIRGLEVSYTQNYDFLPGKLKHLGLTTNVTFTDSRAQVSEDQDSPENGFPFFGTPRYYFNSALFWEEDKLSLRLSYLFRDKSLDEIDQNSIIVRDSFESFDFSASWKVFDQLKLIATVNNMTDHYDYWYQATFTSNYAEIPVFINNKNINAIPTDYAAKVRHLGRSWRIGFKYDLR